MTCISSLNVSGITTLSNNTIIDGDSQFQPKLLLSGGNFTSSDGIAFLIGVNRAGNRHLWIGDRANLTVNTTNSVLRISSNSIDCMATDGSTRLSFYLGGGALTFNANARPVLNKVLHVNATPSDTRASIENIIFTEGVILTGIFGGDTVVTGYWEVAINLNYGGATNGVGGGNNTQSY